MDFVRDLSYIHLASDSGSDDTSNGSDNSRDRENDSDTDDDREYNNSKEYQDESFEEKRLRELSLIIVRKMMESRHEGRGGGLESEVTQHNRSLSDSVNDEIARLQERMMRGEIIQESRSDSDTEMNEGPEEDGLEVTESKDRMYGRVRDTLRRYSSGWIGALSNNLGSYWVPASLTIFAGASILARYAYTYGVRRR